eukprot:maker-scaffold38_size502422-snap-gene-1.18 protein:Tk05865 transcript:maker-scaffold38_size502422-snap-gene-1.18-mRNA-1 annotation:"protein yif1b-b-like"
MSWDQSGYDNSYGNYGQYADQGYYAQPEALPGAQPAYGAYPPTPDYPASPQPPGGGMYNPNHYPQQPQQHQQQPQPHTAGPAAYQSSPMPEANQGGQASGMPFQTMMGDPMVTNMAMQYGQEFMGKQGEEIKKNLDKYVSLGQLKYYFAVDTTYVGKKLGLLLFPFTHSDWSIKYNQDEPVQPKFDINAPDLYIPSMAYITYVLLVGYVLGLRNAFSPDLLATTSSSALVWLVLEMGMIYLSLTLMNIVTNMCKWDILSFSTYKYVAMIFIILIGLVLQSTTAYYVALVYSSGALAIFLVRALKLRIEPEVHGMQTHGKRKLYMILFYAGLQPFFIWWMTSYLVPISSPDIVDAPPPPPLDTY